MNKIEKNLELLKEVFRELRDIVHLKDDDIPSKAWQEKYDFLERLKDHYTEKITHLKWLEVEEALRTIREEEREERLKLENSKINPYQQQHYKEVQERNINERKQQRRESNRRNLKVHKKNVLKEIQDKEEI